MLGSVTDGSTYHPGLPRSVWTSHVLLRYDQVLLRLSSSVKVFYDKTWAMNGEPQYAHGIKRRSTKLLQSLDQKHHYI